jgi:hypothetical protein
MQVPLGLLVAVALGIFAPNLFFPAAMVVVGAHYLAFVFLYGMRSFAMLASVMIVAGVLIAVAVPGLSVAGAWLTVIALVAFSVVALLRRPHARALPL